MDGDEVGAERIALAGRRHEPEVLVSSNIMRVAYIGGAIDINGSCPEWSEPGSIEEETAQFTDVASADPGALDDVRATRG
jgi:hypothetical protein